jgi:hypothetical protein
MQKLEAGTQNGEREGRSRFQADKRGCDAPPLITKLGHVTLARRRAIREKVRDMLRLSATDWNILKKALDKSVFVF